MGQFLREFLQHAQEIKDADDPGPPVPSAAYQQEEPQDFLYTDDPVQKQALTYRVKDWQRRGPGHKLAWHAFCRERLSSTNYDPTRHSVEGLSRFLRAIEQGMVKVDGAAFSLGKEDFAQPLTHRGLSPHAGSRAMRESLKGGGKVRNNASPSTSRSR